MISVRPGGLYDLPKVFRWDLDKTYLKTEFDTARDLIRTAFEPAAKKRTMPGAAALMRELQATAPERISIVSGSPKHMRRVLEAKLRLDGVRWDEFVLKPSLRHILRGRFRSVRDQVAYKLGALMRSRLTLPKESVEVMFGDDAEADAFVYSLYSDLCAGKVSTAVLEAVLEQARIYRDEVPTLLDLAARLPTFDGCLRIFIHLERRSAPDAFSSFGKRVVPFFSYIQPAVVLFELGVLSLESVGRVAADLIASHGASPTELADACSFLVSRGYAHTQALEAIGALRARDLDVAPSVVLDAFFPLAAGVARAVSASGSLPYADIDYVQAFALDRARAREAKRRALESRMLSQV